MANEIAVIEKEFEAKRKDIAAYIGEVDISSSSVQKYMIGALKEIRSNPDLMKCTIESLSNCLVKCAQIRLPVDDRKLAYLVAFKNKQPNGTYALECALWPSYFGYRYKILEARPGSHIIAKCVFKGDKFKVSQRDGIVSYEHESANALDRSPLNITGAYFYVKFPDGASVIEVMDKEELEKIRLCSKACDGNFWKWRIPMYEKTVSRRGSKCLMIDSLAELDALDNKLMDMDRLNNPQVATIAPTAPMPQAIEAAICAEGTSTPESPESAPISEPQAEQAAPDNDTPKADALTFDGVVKAFSPQKGPKPASICIDDVWYQSPSEEVTALIEDLKGQHVSGTYAIQENGKYKNKIITTIGD